jgi:uncharacterized protein involved in exopolysaccharide biosynthesis
MTDNKSDLATHQPLIRGDKLDLKVLFHVLYSGRKRILGTAIVFFIISVLVAFLIPNRYEAGALILPQAGSTSKLDRLGGLASLAGVNINSMIGETSEVSPEVYPAIVYSYPFLKELIDAPYSFQDEPSPLSYFDKETNESAFSLGDLIVNYTLRLPWTLMDLFRSDTDIVKQSSEAVIYVSKKEAEVMNEVRSMIYIDVNSETGLVTLRVEASEPLLAAQMTRRAVELLQKSIINQQTSQVRDNLDFVEERFAEKRHELAVAQEKYHKFLDANRNRVTERSDLQMRELNEAYNIALQLYKNLAEQVEQAKIAVKKQTPAFSIIEPVRVPSEKSFPKRSVFVIMGFLIGFFVGVVGIIGHSLYKTIAVNWANSN